MTMHDGALAINVRGLGKQYQIGAAPGSSSLYERIGAFLGQRSRAPRDPHPTIWALKGIDFTVRRGQVLGVLGRNGSGKSTLLRILARITAPTEGVAEIYGRVGALLEVGTGFHPELTGRENIALSGAILGMTAEDIARVQGQIIDFSEIGKFLDTPVKYYSIGMFLRLAFSVSVHLDAEILLVDEVLAVGDAAFQLKCQQRIRQAVGEGRTVVFVSHSMASVAALCDSAIVLDQGGLRFNGETQEAVDFYTHEILAM
jgi:ABC-type polysaccharide/polyol phosphate transport system, ATPase component